jgi:hypothetical protein
VISPSLSTIGRAMAGVFRATFTAEFLCMSVAIGGRAAEWRA